MIIYLILLMLKHHIDNQMYIKMINTVKKLYQILQLH